jgi:hypothetical protein
MKKKLITMLAYLKEGEGIELAEDTFLVGKELDGSDKCYGFIKRDGQLLVVTRQSSSGYPVEDMDREDLQYMFKLSSVSEEIKNQKYKIVDADDV